MPYYAGMKGSTTPRRCPRRAVLGGAAAAGLALAGCTTSNARPSRHAPPGRGFPVRLRHRYGQTVVERSPQWIVCVGFTDHDAVLALGRVPLALRRWFSYYPDGMGPWARARTHGTTPQVLAGTDIPFEKIAALRPDVIFALYADLSRAEYDRLSSVAPTVTTPAGVPAYGIGWQQQSRLVGQALGEHAAMDKVIADVERRIRDTAAKHPRFDGHSAAIMLASTAGELSAYSSADPRGRLLTALGFHTPAGIDRLAGDSFYADISRERADLLDADLLLVLATSKAGADQVRDDPILQGLPVARHGRLLLVTDRDLISAYSTSSALSLPYTLQRLGPRLAATLRPGG